MHLQGYISGGVIFEQLWVLARFVWVVQGLVGALWLKCHTALSWIEAIL